MPRPLRIEFPGAIWHITSRGNNRQDIYHDDADRRRFLGYLARTVTARRWRLHAWVLMSNHYHLLVETPEVGLSRGMKWLNQKYAESFNRRHGRIGHLFQARFKGILVQREGHVLELIRYVVLNPVRAHLVAFAGDYEWSNYRSTAGLRTRPSWLEVDWTLRQFSTDEGYRRFVAQARGASCNPLEAAVGEVVLGGETVEHPRPSLDSIAGGVADVFETTAEMLKYKSRGPARKAFVQLAMEEGGSTARSIAEWMCAGESAVGKMGGAARKLYAEDGCYRERVERVRSALSLVFRT